MNQPEKRPDVVTDNKRKQLLELADRLAQPEISREIRMGLVNQLRLVLKVSKLICLDNPMNTAQPILEHPPPVYFCLSSQ